MKKSIIALANEKVPFPLAAQWAGCEVYSDPGERGVKTYCPFGLAEHDDGGDEPALRVYADHGFCVDMETEILSQRGWLRGDEVACGDIVLTYREGATRWEPVQAVVRLPAQSRRMLSMETKTHSSLTTADHRWLTYRHGRKERVTTSGEGFRPGDTVPFIGGPCVTLPEEPVFSDAFVELVGWFFTEGSVWKSGGVRAGVTIHQSHRVNPEFCARIRAALRACYGEPSDTIRQSHGWREAVREAKGMTEFILSVPLSAELLAVAPGKVVSFAFLNCLTASQLRIFIETALDADGSRIGNWRQLCQAQGNRLDAFQAACLLLGTPARVWQRAGPPQDWACQLLNTAGFRPRYWEQKGAVRWVRHEGPVWCVQTPSATWVARRHGAVYVTGNCFACSTPGRGYGRYFTAVSLLAESWQLDRQDAAAEALKRVGHVPASYAHLFEQADRDPEPDGEALAEALVTWCSARCPDWHRRSTQDPAVTRQLSRCLGLLPRVRDAQDCETWLAAAKMAMAQVLTPVN